MNERDYMQHFDGAMDMVFGKPLPGEADQPDDRGRMEHDALESLYCLWADSIGFLSSLPHNNNKEILRVENDIIGVRAETVATAMGLKKEWKQLLEERTREA